MKYQVHFFSSAAKEFQKLPNDAQKKVLHVLDMLRIDPYSEILKIRKLKGGHDLFRIRLGNYRLVYKIESDSSLIIVRIRHRKLELMAARKTYDKIRQLRGKIKFSLDVKKLREDRS